MLCGDGCAGGVCIPARPQLISIQSIVVGRGDIMAYLRLYQHEINEQDDKIMFDVFIGEVLTFRALGEADAFA